MDRGGMLQGTSKSELKTTRNWPEINEQGIGKLQKEESINILIYA